MKVLFLLAACSFVLGGCVRHVEGDRLDLHIKRNPHCIVKVKMDGKLVLEAKASTPCKKGE